MSNKILITGVEGFIGYNLMKGCLKKGYDVLGGVQSKNKLIKLKNKENHKNLNLIEFDITKPKRWDKRKLENIDYIFHLAAQTNLKKSFIDPVKDLEVNVVGTINLLNLFKDVPIKNFILASTGSVYGNPIYTPTDEKHPTNPTSPYGLSKLFAEKYCILYNNLYDINVKIIRLFNPYGPNQNDRLISNWIRKIKNKEYIEIFGDGKQKRCFTYIDDVVDAFLLAMKNKSKNIIFNIASKDSFEIKDVVKKLEKISKTKINIRYLAENPHDIKIIESDISLAENILKFKSKISFEEGLRRCYVSYIKN